MSAAPPQNRHRDDVRVARVHLRLGQLALARAELEDLLRRNALDGGSMAALAEARWRTGDPDGAAEAAFRHIEAGGADDVALCIAVEAAAADGRVAEAKAMMDRLPASDAATLDALFAGMPRRAFWPAGPVDRSAIIDLRREAELRASGQRPGGSPARGSQPRATAASARHEAAQAPPPSAGAPGRRVEKGELPEVRSVPGPRAVIEATSSAEWRAASPHRTAGRPDGGDAHATTVHPGRRAAAQLDPGAELERARQDLETAPDRAFLRLALVLRQDPTFAPTVIELLRLRREPGAALVRGDAQRLLGRHLEAEAAFDAAAESLEVS